MARQRPRTVPAAARTADSSGPAEQTARFPGARRPYLVFVRAGADSVHQRLLRENPDRNWDCCVNWYIEPPAEDLADYYWSSGSETLNKYDGFLDFRAQLPALWPYRYVVLLDDDVYLRPGDLSRFFQLCNYYGTYLSQPALRWFTHTTLNSLVRNPVCTLRRVSFIEAMAPCFSAAALDDLIHTFSWTRSVWGMDWAWAGLLQNRVQLHVVDAVAMDHTRTGNGRPTLFYRRLQAAGADPHDDLRRMQLLFPDFSRPQTLEDGHVFRSGVPRQAAHGLLVLFERLKFIVRLRKQLLRTLRLWRVRLEDRLRGGSA